MTVLLIALALVTALATSVSIVLLLRIRAMRQPADEELPKTPVVLETEGSNEGIVFGLPPAYHPKDLQRLLKMDGQVETDTHPCDFLSKVHVSRFREGECQGICWHQDQAQRGRVCFWMPQSATNCSWFRPRVRPTKVQLKKIRAGEKST